MRFLRKSEDADFPSAIVLSANHLMCKCELLTILSNIALGMTDSKVECFSWTNNPKTYFLGWAAFIDIHKSKTGIKTKS